MAFIVQKLTAIDPAKLGYLAAQVGWEECAIDEGRNIIAISHEIHHSNHPDQGFELWVDGRKVFFGFTHAPKWLAESPTQIFFEARWSVPSDLPEQEEKEISGIIVEAVRCLCAHSITASDGTVREIKVLAARPNPPPDLNQILSKVNTLVQMFFTAEAIKGREMAEIAASPAFQETVLLRLREFVLGNPRSRELLLKHIADKGYAGLTVEARLAIEWWRLSEH